MSYRMGCPTPTKKVFVTEREARRAARRLNLKVYRCACGYWHLTSMTRTERRRVIRRLRKQGSRPVSTDAQAA